jgi:tetratricopeptide (TPR) repeat protein
MAQSDLGTETTPTAPPIRTDLWLNIAVAALLAVVIGGIAFFGYSVYRDRQIEDASSATGRIVAALASQVRKNPNDAILRVRLGEGYGAMGKFQEAIDQFNAAIKIDPKHTGAYLDLGMVATLTNNDSAAEGYYLKVISLTDGQEYSNLSTVREQAFYNLGTMMLKQKRYADAAGYFKGSLQIKSDASDTYYSLAKAYQGLGDNESAMRQLLIAVQFDPGFAEAHYFLGQLYEQKKDDVNAAEQFALAVKMAPGADQPRQALDAYGSASDWIAKANTALGSGDTEAALNAARIAIAIEPDNFDAAKLKGQIYVELGDPVNALDAYKAAAVINPKDAAVQAQIAALTKQIKALTPAKAAAKKKAAVKKAAKKKAAVKKAAATSKTATPTTSGK